MKAQFSQKISSDRKAMMNAIAAITHTEVQYRGAPSFAYETGNWRIDREGVLTSPVFDMDAGGPLFHADLMGTLGKQGIVAEGMLTVSIFPDDYDPTHLHNIRAILAGKASLFRHALGVKEEPSAVLFEGGILVEYGLDGGFAFPFYPATMTFAGILAALQFSERVHAQAVSQKKVRTKDAVVANEKYAMRCFLLRIGMIGAGYATARKELLRRLSGDSSFKSGPRPVDVPATGVTVAALEDGAMAQESGLQGLETTSV